MNGAQTVLSRTGLDELIAALIDDGYHVIRRGPVPEVAAAMPQLTRAVLTELGQP